MSGRRQKEIRQQQRMQQREEIYSFKHLESFISLCELLSGVKPASISVTESFYNWFIQEAQRHAETLGLKPGFQNDQPVFLGVKIEKKVTIHPAKPLSTITPSKN